MQDILATASQVQQAPFNWNIIPGWIQLLITLAGFAVYTGLLLNRVAQLEKAMDSLKTEVASDKKAAESRMNKVEIDQKGLDVSQKALLNSAEQMQRALDRLEDKLDRVLSR